MKFHCWFLLHLPSKTKRKLSKIRKCLLVSFHERIYVIKTKGHCLGNFPFQLKSVSMKCKLHTKTVDYVLAQLSAH